MRSRSSSGKLGKALETFINGIDDIKLGIRAYSRSGN